MYTVVAKNFFLISIQQYFRLKKYNKNKIIWTLLRVWLGFLSTTGCYLHDLRVSAFFKLSAQLKAETEADGNGAAGGEATVSGQTYVSNWISAPPNCTMTTLLQASVPPTYFSAELSEKEI